MDGHIMNIDTSVGNENSVSIDQKAESVTTIKAIRLAALVTAINVLVASGFVIAAIIRPQLVVPAGSVPTEASLILALYAAARTIPLWHCLLWRRSTNVRRRRC